MEESDQLVRLSIGGLPIEAAYTDSAFLLGEWLYLHIHSDGRMAYINARLTVRLLKSIQRLDRKGAISQYRYANGRLTSFGRHLALLFLSRGVSVGAIVREFGVSRRVIERLQQTTGE